MKKPKKILIFSLDYLPGTISGAEAAIQEITSRIDPQEIEFHMVTLYYDSEVPRKQKFGNVTVHYVGLWGKPNATLEQRRQFPLHYNKHYFQFAAGLKAFRLHRKHRYDGAWAMMAHGTGVPVSIFNLLTGVPYALTLQEGDPPEHIERTMRPLWPLFKRAFRKARVVQSISTFLAQWAKRMGHPKEVIIVRNGANPDSLNPSFDTTEIDQLKKKLGKQAGDVWLVNTSRLVHQKGFDTVIQSLTHLPAHIKFLAVGGGPDEAKLKSLVKELQLVDRVIFTGQVERSEVSKYRFVGDMFVAPSRSEGLGNAFISAMACRLPVIASQVGGIADYLFDKDKNPDISPTGFAVEPDNPKQIADRVEYVLNHPQEVKQVVINARSMVEREYDWDNIARTMQKEVFQTLWT